MLKKTLILCAALCMLLSMPSMAGEWKDTMKEFPASGRYVINSSPTFNVTVGDTTELVVGKAELILITSEPYETADGRRQVDLEVVNWSAVAKSELLGDLKFQKTGESPEPSFVRSYADWTPDTPADFPALAQFAVQYELTTKFGKVSGLMGITNGRIHTFPPTKGDLFVMEKGTTAEVTTALMPEPVSSLSAAGVVTPVNVKVRPTTCGPTDE